MSTAPATSIDQDVVAFVEKSGAAFAKAEALFDEIEKDQTKAASYRGAVVDRLVACGSITTSQRDRANEKLASHTGTTEVMLHLLDDLIEAKQGIKSAAAVSGASQGELHTGRGTAPAVKQAWAPIGAANGYLNPSPADRSFADAILSR